MDEQRIWLLSGTGEGPPLAAELLRRGWQLRVSVVSSAAARAYPAHPALELQVGALGDEAAVQNAIAQWDVLRPQLEAHGIYSIGRYGDWTYCAIEDNIVQARKLSKQLS